MDIYVGLARYNEFKQQTGGEPGDQLQITTPDPNGEVALISLADYLKDSGGCTIYRTKDPLYSAPLADGVVKGCNNPYIGYDATNRLSILTYGIYSGKNGKNAECDNTSFARVVIKYGTGIDLGDFHNDDVRAYFNISNVFLTSFPYSDGATLYEGDILVTTNGNIVGIIGSGPVRPIPHPGEGGTTDYNDLDNKPSLNGITLEGNTTLSELGIVTPKVDNENVIFS